VNFPSVTRFYQVLSPGFTTRFYRHQVLPGFAPGFVTRFCHQVLSPGFVTRFCHQVLSPGFTVTRFYQVLPGFHQVFVTRFSVTRFSPTSPGLPPGLPGLHQVYHVTRFTNQVYLSPGLPGFLCANSGSGVFVTSVTDQSKTSPPRRGSVWIGANENCVRSQRVRAI
jgi:hypothetical protein